MEDWESSPSDAYKSSTGVEEIPSCSGVVESLEHDGGEQILIVEDAPLIGVLVEAAAALEADAVAWGEEEGTSAVPVSVEVKTVENISGKRKRGRPPKDAVAVSALGTDEGSRSAPVSLEVKTLENNAKRTRGRPPKEAVVVASDVVQGTEEGSSSVPSAEVKKLENTFGKRTRGRPPKEAGFVAIDVDQGIEEDSSSASMSVEMNFFDDPCERRKRGRPPKGMPKLPQPVKKKKDEEDVCFICFDGGSLVLCDRRGCPKAYHPACVKRDEAFFQSNARWDCGWHICSICEKAANYMCYTCTYSLCKACTRDADYVCARENKGFCSMCMKTIMLIEKKDQMENDNVVVDFDDKSSWEYLFKMYWLYSKQKLSLTLDELTKARNPWKVDGHIILEGRDVDSIGSKKDLQHPNFGVPPLNGSKQQTRLLNGNVFSTISTLGSDESAYVSFSAKWASKELLAFVAHVKNGDISELSIQDTQALLLDYVKRNNLPDPSQKSQIICDSRLLKLFGKPRVGHIEMLKLLEYHFPIKDDSVEDVNRSNIYPAVASQAYSNTNSRNSLVLGTEMKSKTLRMGDDKGFSANLHEFAAVDVHNISLIYLRRGLIENLIDESGKLHDNVVGSFVRIVVSGGDHEQDIFRLVQVVGTCKVATPYKIGAKFVNVALEILNLDKKEVISISAISNNEFSEDECRRLRESIKCGLVKHLTVGQILEISKALREVKVNDWLEREVQRLNQLCDQANEKGQEKDLREFVEKIEHMKTPEERQRRLLGIPEVHLDPHIKATNLSDEASGLFAAKNQAAYGKTRCSEFNINEKEAILSKDYNKSYATHNNKFKGISNNIDMENKSAASDSTKPSNGGISLEASVTSLSTGTPPPPSEADNIWHYRDPSGNIQGPFCLLMLRKWSLSGYFPSDLRIWNIYDKETDSLLLLNLLKGQQPNKENTSDRSWPSATNLKDKQTANCQDKLGSGVNCIDINKTGSPCLESFKVNDLSSSKQVESSSLPHERGSNDVENVIHCENQSKHRDYFSHSSSGNSWRPPPFSPPPPNKLDLNTSFSFETKSNNSGSDIPKEQSKLLNAHIEGSQHQNQPKPTLNLDYNMEEKPPVVLRSQHKGVPVSEKKQQSLSLSSNFEVCNSATTWSSSSGLFLGGSVPQSQSRQEIGNNMWIGHPPAVKTTVEELGLGLIPVKPSESSNNNYPPGSDTISTTHPTLGWLAMVTEPIELSTLAEESVSDLLAEVDALESQGGLPSPTSAMNYVDYLFEETVNGCFNPIGSLNHQQHHHHSSTTTSTSSAIQETSTITHDGMKRTSWSGSLDVDLGNMNSSGWEGGGRVNGNLHRSGGSGGGVLYTGGPDGNSSRFNGDRNRQSLTWNRHSSSSSIGNASGGRGGGALPPHPPAAHKGGVGGQQQRVCKFNESGRCKKGAYCEYLHP